MKVLLDENLDHALRKLLGSHEIVTVAFMGWTGLKNGMLLKAAEDGEIDVLLTGDQTMHSEQNVIGMRLAIVALSAIQLPIIRESRQKSSRLSILQHQARIRKWTAESSVASKKIKDDTGTRNHPRSTSRYMDRTGQARII